MGHTHIYICDDQPIAKGGIIVKRRAIVGDRGREWLVPAAMQPLHNTLDELVRAAGALREACAAYAKAVA